METRGKDRSIFINKVRAFLIRYGKDPNFMSDKEIANYGKQGFSVYETGTEIIKEYY